MLSLWVQSGKKIFLSGPDPQGWQIKCFKATFHCYSTLFWLTRKRSMRFTLQCLVDLFDLVVKHQVGKCHIETKFPLTWQQSHTWHIYTIISVLFSMNYLFCKRDNMTFFFFSNKLYVITLAYIFIFKNH